MKILAIRGKNLASLEDEFSIDFTVEPLKSAGIFAITGNTGSGKSTLLDAMCLALFNDTPRTNRTTENADIVDTKDSTINQKDSRTILRKGTSEGYAEVDYQALSGEKYRSKWSVKRAYNKIDGKMGSAEIKVTNLTSGAEVQGTKTELLRKNTEFIGLTFEQFTRAVLLAQGDFATFLKAKEADKAELLEKLTGTDIYSHISILIFEKAKEAKNIFKEVQNKIENVELLDADRITNLGQEKDDLKVLALKIKESISCLTAKTKWISENEIFEKDLQQARTKLSQSELAIISARPRFELITQNEEAQEIRDTFYLYQNAKKQLQTESELLKKQEKDLEQLSIREKEYSESIIQHEEKSKQNAEKEEKIRPQILKARELDILFQTRQKSLIEKRNESEKSFNNKTKFEKDLSETQKEIQKTTNDKAKSEEWLNANEIHKSIISDINMIIRDIDALTEAEKQETANANLLIELDHLIIAEKQKLDIQKKESERLNCLLPAEIAILRAKLCEGEPCPVCGSIHHNVQASINLGTLQEEEINEAKKKNAKEIENTTALIETREKEANRIKTLIESYAQQITRLTVILDPQLAYFPNWKEMALKKQLQPLLKQLATDWEKNLASKIASEQNLAALNAKKQVLANSLESSIAEFSIQKKSYEQIRKEFIALETERKEILEGKSADEVESILKQRRENIEQNLAKLKSTQSSIIAEKARLMGSVEQIKGSCTIQKSAIDKFSQEIKQWMNEKGKDLSEIQLKELLNKDAAWIKAEKEYLNKLKETRTQDAATLTERHKKLEEHQNSEFRPQEEETKNLLEQQLNEKNTLVEQKTKRISEIEVLLENQKKNEDKIKTLEKELQTKKELSENWEKLNILLGSAEGVKFKKIAQGYTLDALLGCANKHLRELTNRYELQRIPDTLALQVIDLDMLGEARTVHSLSGGESFLVSLSLALALSSLSSNRMSIESLFIDEGFGSLDIDTLRIALDALERLQSQGRRIGVISHVSEMTERITTQIKVEKNINGKSFIKIVG